MPRNPIVRAAAVQSLPVAQEIMDAVRAAYLAQPGAALISGITLNPLEVLAMNSQSGQSFRVPVTIAGDGGLSFGPPIQPRVPGGTPRLPGLSASSSVSARDQQRIQAAVDRGAISPQRAEFYVAEAAAGRDISQLAQLEGDLLPAGGAVAASAAPRDADAEYPEYSKLFGTVQAGQQVADDREIAARAAVAALTDDQVYESLYGLPGAPAAPVVASAAGPTGQHGQGGAARTRWRVHAPLVSLRVPQDPNVAASADPGTTSWRIIELRGGDLVPEHAHPADVERLRHQKNRLGPLIKPW